MKQLPLIFLFLILLACAKTMPPSPPTTTLISTSTRVIPVSLDIPVSRSTEIYTNTVELTVTNTALPMIVMNATATPIPMPTDTPIAETPLTFAVIGDFGEVGQPVLKVANMVKSWQPQLIITVGDNNYPDGAAETIDDNIGQYYHDYIGNYQGKYGTGAAENNFFPVLGNHDWVTRLGKPALPQPYLDYFTLPGNERYYTFQRGAVAFFALDNENLEPDGNTADSVQAQWLQQELAASAAPWKLVYMHRPPYVSKGLHESDKALQWPYKAWGATAVLAGHNHFYERLEVDGLPYFVNGTGGQGGIYKIKQVIPESLVRYDKGHGAMFITATSTMMTFQYITLKGEVLDEFEITK